VVSRTDTIGRGGTLHRGYSAVHISDTSDSSKPASAPLGSEGAPTGSYRAPLGSISSASPWREVIVQKLEAGLTARRVYQDISSDHGYAGSYYSVRRLVKKLTAAAPAPFRRMECEAGAEAQVDFGRGAPLIGPDGKRKATWVFRIVLSHSRKGYAEAVQRQTTDDFLRCLENAFTHFGGMPRTLVIDNLRAAVTRADWFDPELCPKVRSFAEHYGIAILPTKPYTPRHKGKIERGIGYVKSNALADLLVVELGAESFDERIKLPARQHFIEFGVERMSGRLSEIRGRHEKGLLLIGFAFAHRHKKPPCSVRKQISAPQAKIPVDKLG
jgi:transposase